MKKIVQYVGSMDRAGAETLVMNIFRASKSKYQFIFIYHKREKCDYDDEIKKLGGVIRYIEVPSVRNYKKFRKNLKELLSEFGKIDAIHSHLNLMNGFILKAANECKIPVRISHSHSNKSIEKETFERKIYTSIAKSLIKKYATQQVACSKEAGKYLYKNNMYEVITNAIEVDKFKGEKYFTYLNEEFGLDRNIKKITHIGRFVEVKNHIFIIKVFSKAIKEDENIRLFLCGTGELKKEIMKLVQDLEIQDKVYFLGVRKDINKILLSTDVFFMPSKIEGVPLALIEAQVAGCKCIISDEIPLEADIGLDQVEYLRLDEVEESWVKHILNGNRTEEEFEKRRKKIEVMGYDMKTNIKSIHKIYDK